MTAALENASCFTIDKVGKTIPLNDELNFTKLKGEIDKINANKKRKKTIIRIRKV